MIFGGNKDIVDPFRLVKDLLISTSSSDMAASISATRTGPTRSSSFAANTKEGHSDDMDTANSNSVSVSDVDNSMNRASFTNLALNGKVCSIRNFKSSLYIFFLFEVSSNGPLVLDEYFKDDYGNKFVKNASV